MGLFLYLSQLKENKITWYAVDSATGDLARQGDIATPGAPGVQGPRPARKILSVAMRSPGALCSFRSDPHSGRLNLLHALDTGLADPGYMATDRTGRYLITPYYESACVTVYAIDDDGVAREPGANLSGDYRETADAGGVLPLGRARREGRGGCG